MVRSREQVAVIGPNFRFTDINGTSEMVRDAADGSIILIETARRAGCADMKIADGGPLHLLHCRILRVQLRAHF